MAFFSFFFFFYKTFAVVIILSKPQREAGGTLARSKWQLCTRSGGVRVLSSPTAPCVLSRPQVRRGERKSRGRLLGERGKRVPRPAPPQPPWCSGS